MATDAGVCWTCAAKGHLASACPKRPKNGQRNGKATEDRGGSQLNALIPGYSAALGSQMQIDLEYLCSLAENTPLAMFSCFIIERISEGIPTLVDAEVSMSSISRHGVTLLNIGASQNYIS